MFSWLPRDPPPVGQKAPAFTLLSGTGKKGRPSTFRGKNVVLLFYPANDTPIYHFCEFWDVGPDLRRLNTVVFGINPQTTESHREFSSHSNFPFPLLVDDDQEVAALSNFDGGMVNRTVYLVGPDGLIRYARRGMPRPEEVLAAAVHTRRASRRKAARTRRVNTS